MKVRHTDDVEGADDDDLVRKTNVVVRVLVELIDAEDQE